MTNDTHPQSDHLTLDEIVFENRNKEYGAYYLRSIYRKYLTRSFVIGTLIFFLLALVPLVYITIKNLGAEKKKEVNASLIEILDDESVVEDIIPEETPPPPPPKEEPPQQEVIQNVVPEPVKEPKIETPPPKIEEQVVTTTGLQNVEGEKIKEYIPPPPPPSTAVDTGINDKEVYDKVDQAAEFANGGIDAFRRKFQENFDADAMEGEGSVKTVVTFTVSISGTISDVKAAGPNKAFNREAEETIRSIKGKWIPGKINGRPVNSKFRFPITMNFE
ncbi:MAG: energy transducer TonB [Bergeyella sp.]|nr:energy transducer TonB [Bergeyella sp.]